MQECHLSLRIFEWQNSLGNEEKIPIKEFHNCLFDDLLVFLQGILDLKKYGFHFPVFSHNF